MKPLSLVAGVITLTMATPAFAHRVDEYLEAATLTLSRDRLQVDLRLVPGVAVARSVLDGIDSNRDGAISRVEEQEYQRVVLGDLTLTIDGSPVALRPLTSRFGSADELKEGVGEIQFVFEARAPSGGARRHVVFENRHRSAIAAYLVNSLVPAERDLRITSQKRDYRQSVYEMSYELNGADAGSVTFASLASWGAAAVALAILISGALKRLRSR